MLTSIHEACRKGDLEAVKSLVSADPTLVDADDQYDWRPIFHAALHRQLEVVRFLINAGADVSAHDGYALHYGGEVPNNKAVVELLVTYGALETHVRPTTDSSRQFLAALFIGNESRVQSMLEKDPSLATTADGRGDHPIHHASRNGDTRIVELLINSGADVNVISQRGHTVLYCAGGHGHVDTVKQLIAHGADVDARLPRDGKNLKEWLAQYPDDKRFAEISKLLPS